MKKISILLESRNLKLGLHYAKFPHVSLDQPRLIMTACQICNFVLQALKILYRNTSH